ncbi:MAG: hypothetical protein RI558_04325 [Psychroflexus sp.]|jgi:hypothetical protein|nr:hypothetical protein [Psychroflexus sp.]MDR9448388.1 hypothetical protein [Psychroflexus sp.]
MKTIFSLLIIFLSLTGYAQIDRDNNTSSTGGLLSTGRSSGMGDYNIPDRSSSNELLLPKKEKGVKFGEGEKFAKPTAEFEKRLKAALDKDEKKVKDDYKSDMDLGEFVVDENSIKIVCRDHMQYDGDRVQIRLNGEIIIENILLKPGYTTINLPLKEGFNKIDFVALNQGESGPNTAELRIFKPDGELITANIWNLLTGVKASTVIVKPAE